MFEVIVTVVKTETVDEQTHPFTQVFRLEFDTEEELEVWLFANATREALNVEQLKTV